MALHSRPQRVADVIKTAVADVLQNELKDPRLLEHLITVSQVTVTKDLQNAQIFVSVLGDEAAGKEVLKGLEHSAGYIKRGIASRVDLRFMPSLTFRIDETAKQAARLQSLLTHIERTTPVRDDEPEDENASDEKE